jgi:multiple sugar transport system substrate-binding protein
MIELVGVTWDHPRGVCGLRATAAAWTRDHPDVRVEWRTRSLQAFADQPVDELAAGADLLVIDHPTIGDAVEADALAPLDELVDGLPVPSVGRSAESYRWAGSTWALPVDAAAQVAAYRPDLLDRAGVAPPTTWGEVLEAADRLRAAGMWIAMPAIPVDAICAFLGACSGWGDEPFASSGRFVGRSTALAVLELLREVIALGHPDSLVGNPPMVLRAMVATDEIAYCPSTFGYTDFARPSTQRRVRFAPGPRGPGGRPSGTLGGAGIAVSSGTGAVEVAAEYAAFSMRADVQRTTYLEAGGQPGHRDAWLDPEADRIVGGFFSDTLEGIDAGFLRPRDPGFSRFQDEAGAAVHRWLAEGGDAGSVADELDEIWSGVAAAAVPGEERR